MNPVCEEVQRRFWSLSEPAITDDPDAEALACLRAHLAACPECQAEFDRQHQFRQTVERLLVLPLGGLQSVSPAPDVWKTQASDLVRQVVARLRSKAATVRAGSARPVHVVVFSAWHIARELPLAAASPETEPVAQPPRSISLRSEDERVHAQLILSPDTNSLVIECRDPELQSLQGSVTLWINDEPPVTEILHWLDGVAHLKLPPEMVVEGNGTMELRFDTATVEVLDGPHTPD